MKNAENYVFGKPRVPPWAGDVLKDVKYSKEGNLVSAIATIAKDERVITQGDVLMKLENVVVLVPKKQAKKYGVTK